MGLYKIADLVVRMEPVSRTLKQSEKYRLNDPSVDKEDITLSVSDARIRELSARYPGVSSDDLYYMESGRKFYKSLLSFDGFLLHASAVVYENRAYLFSADSGVGKSTHTNLWLEMLGNENAYLINDDKPALRFINDELYVYGTPWSGKQDKSVNTSVPLQGICFLKRGSENEIHSLSTVQAIGRIIKQTLHLRFDEQTMKYLYDRLDRLISKYNIFEMECLPDISAAELSFSTLKERGLK